MSEVADLQADWRWTSRHYWVRASDITYATLPPQYDFRCTRCNRICCAPFPPDDECAGPVKP